jgi:hypothetical protein
VFGRNNTKNTFIIIGTNGLILYASHKYSGVWKEFNAVAIFCVRIIIIIIIIIMLLFLSLVTYFKFRLQYFPYYV